MAKALPAMDAGGDGTALASLVDVTELQRLSAELDASLAEARRAHRELETFTYSVSHDLKAPLRGLDGYSQLLLSRHAAQLDEEGRHFLQRIRTAAQQMAQLTDDLLAYARLERRTQALGAKSSLSSDAVCMPSAVLPAALTRKNCADCRLPMASR